MRVFTMKQKTFLEEYCENIPEEFIEWDEFQKKVSRLADKYELDRVENYS